MRTPCQFLFPFACFALLGLLACSSNQPSASPAASKPAAPSSSAPAPAAGAAPASAPAAPPAGWKTVTSDSKTCKLSLPSAWVGEGAGAGMYGRMEKGEMAMFLEDEQTQKAGNWDPVHREIEKKKATGAKVEILEESANRIIFQAPQGSVLAVMAFQRSSKRLCAAQIGVPVGDPASQKIARQIAESLASAP